MHIGYLKVCLVSALLLAGAVFLALGTGVEIPLINYKGIEAYNIPAGIALLITAVALAHFWRVSTSETVEESRTTTSDGNGTTTTETTKKTTTITTLAKPPF